MSASIGTAALERAESQDLLYRSTNATSRYRICFLKTPDVEAHRRGVKKLKVDSNVTGATFYEIRGFRCTGRVLVRSAGTQIKMERKQAQIQQQGRAAERIQ